jgi:hypothetical protein
VDDSQGTFLFGYGEGMQTVAEAPHIAIQIMLRGIDVDKHSERVPKDLAHLVQFSEIISRAGG